MAHGKDRHYWTQLRGALTAGQWSSPTPAKTPKGVGLSWPELLRKFKKHVRGYHEVADVASQTQALALLLGENEKREGQIMGQLDLEGECTLLEERIEEARGGIEVLEKLEASSFNSLLLALSYYAYALNRPSECLLYLSKVSDLCDIQSHIPASATTTRSNTSNLQVPDGSSSTQTGSFVSTDTSVSVSDISDGRAWAIIESIRSVCLQGMSHEKLSPTDLQKALDAYCTAIPLITIIESEIPRTLPPTGAGKLDFTSFNRFREMWLWIDRLLWRAIILASKTCPVNPTGSNDDGILWKLLSHYRTCSTYWPTKFKTEHRSIVAVLHLRALVIRAQISRHRQVLDKPPAWMGDARAVIADYRAILSVCTRFPKAGERNVQVEEFVDLCVAVWEASGAIGDHAGWVIDILWWATRLTFNSYRIFRHMTRLFYVSGDVQLARRTLRLYVQVVGKAWEAGGAGVGVDSDSNRNWVETLTQGARMLCRLAGSNGVNDAREAGVLVEKAKIRLDLEDKELVAKVSLAEGIWSSTMGLVEHEPRTRPSCLAHSLAQFAASVEAFPTPSGYYHLALALAKPGSQQNLDQAIISASSAVEGAPTDVRYWHLLGLLLTANGKWNEAKGVLDIGASKGEIDDSDEGLADGNEGIGLSGINGQNGVIRARDFAGTTSESIGEANGYFPHSGAATPIAPVFLLDQGSKCVPPPATLLQPLPDSPPPSRQDAFEHALQIRMTQLALAECVEGAEGAGLKWVEVFGWVAGRKGVVSEQQRSSIDTARNSEENRPPSDYALANPHASEGGHTSTSEKHVHDPQGLNSALESNAEPPPITVTPATPAEPDFLTSDKRSMSIDRESSTGKKVQQMLKSRVHKSQRRISTISKKIGHGMGKNGNASLRRATSAPDFHELLQHKPYQASSIHSRRRLSFIRPNEPAPTESPPPPPLPTLSPENKGMKWDNRVTKESRLLSDLWLMSAATFRRLGKIEQAKGAIQEGEVKDEDNPAVWVQLGLYYMALGNHHHRHAIDAFQKALFIAPDDVSATIHLCRVYLTPSKRRSQSVREEEFDVDPDSVDLAAGMLSHSVKGAAWDVPEAWYFLAKAYGLQGRRDKEREALALALNLSERRTVRDFGLAIGWCL